MVKHNFSGAGSVGQSADQSSYYFPDQGGKHTVDPNQPCEIAVPHLWQRYPSILTHLPFSNSLPMSSLTPLHYMQMSRICAEHNPAGGAVFSFTLPIVEED